MGSGTSTPVTDGDEARLVATLARLPLAYVLSCYSRAVDVALDGLDGQWTRGRTRGNRRVQQRAPLSRSGSRSALRSTANAARGLPPASPSGASAMAERRARATIFRGSMTRAQFAHVFTITRTVVPGVDDGFGGADSALAPPGGLKAVARVESFCLPMAAFELLARAGQLHMGVATDPTLAVLSDGGKKTVTFGGAGAALPSPAATAVGVMAAAAAASTADGTSGLSARGGSGSAAGAAAPASFLDGPSGGEAPFDLGRLGGRPAVRRPSQGGSTSPRRQRGLQVSVGDAAATVSLAGVPPSPAKRHVPASPAARIVSLRGLPVPSPVATSAGSLPALAFDGSNGGSRGAQRGASEGPRPPSHSTERPVRRDSRAQAPAVHAQTARPASERMSHGINPLTPADSTPVGFFSARTPRPGGRHAFAAWHGDGEGGDVTPALHRRALSHSLSRHASHSSLGSAGAPTSPRHSPQSGSLDRSRSVSGSPTGSPGHDALGVVPGDSDDSSADSPGSSVDPYDAEAVAAHDERRRRKLLSDPALAALLQVADQPVDAAVEEASLARLDAALQREEKRLLIKVGVGAPVDAAAARGRAGAAASAPVSRSHSHLRSSGVVGGSGGAIGINATGASSMSGGTVGSRLRGGGGAPRRDSVNSRRSATTAASSIGGASGSASKSHASAVGSHRRGAPASAPGAAEPGAGAGLARPVATWDDVVERAQAIINCGEMFTLAALLSRGSVEGKAAFLYELFSGDSDVGQPRCLSPAGVSAMVSAACTVWTKLHELAAMPAPSTMEACVREIVRPLAKAVPLTLGMTLFPGVAALPLLPPAAAGASLVRSSAGGARASRGASRGHAGARSGVTAEQPAAMVAHSTPPPISPMAQPTASLATASGFLGDDAGGATMRDAGGGDGAEMDGTGRAGAPMFAADSAMLHSVDEMDDTAAGYDGAAARRTRGAPPLLVDLATARFADGTTARTAGTGTGRPVGEASSSSVAAGALAGPASISTGTGRTGSPSLSPTRSPSPLRSPLVPAEGAGGELTSPPAHVSAPVTMMGEGADSRPGSPLPPPPTRLVIDSADFVAWATQVSGLDHSGALIRSYLHIVAELARQFGGASDDGAAGRGARAGPASVPRTGSLGARTPTAGDAAASGGHDGTAAPTTPTSKHSATVTPAAARATAAGAGSAPLGRSPSSFAMAASPGSPAAAPADHPTAAAPVAAAAAPSPAGKPHMSALRLGALSTHSDNPSGANSGRGSARGGPAGGATPREGAGAGPGASLSKWAGFPATVNQVLLTQASQLLLAIYIHGDLRGMLGFMRCQQMVLHMRSQAAKAKWLAIQARRDPRISQRALAPAALHAPPPSPRTRAVSANDPTIIAATAGIALDILWFRLALTIESPWQSSKLATLPAGLQGQLAVSALMATMQSARLMLHIVTAPQPTPLPPALVGGAAGSSASPPREAGGGDSLTARLNTIAVIQSLGAAGLAMTAGSAGLVGRLPGARGTSVDGAAAARSRRLSQATMGSTGTVGRQRRRASTMGKPKVPPPAPSPQPRKGGGKGAGSKGGEGETIFGAIILSPRRKARMTTMTNKARASRAAGFARPGVLLAHSPAEVAFAAAMRGGPAALAAALAGGSAAGASSGGEPRRRTSVSAPRRASSDFTSSAIARAEHDFVSLARTLQVACEQMEDAERIRSGAAKTAATSGGETFRRNNLRQTMKRAASKAAVSSAVTTTLAESETVTKNRRVRAMSGWLESLGGAMSPMAGMAQRSTSLASPKLVKRRTSLRGTATAVAALTGRTKSPSPAPGAGTSSGPATSRRLGASSPGGFHGPGSGRGFGASGGSTARRSGVAAADASPVLGVVVRGGEAGAGAHTTEHVVRPHPHGRSIGRSSALAAVESARRQLAASEAEVGKRSAATKARRRSSGSDGMLVVAAAAAAAAASADGEPDDTAYADTGAASPHGGGAWLGPSPLHLPMSPRDRAPSAAAHASYFSPAAPPPSRGRAVSGTVAPATGSAARVRLAPLSTSSLGGFDREDRGGGDSAHVVSSAPWDMLPEQRRFHPKHFLGTLKHVAARSPGIAASPLSPLSAAEAKRHAASMAHLSHIGSAPALPRLGFGRGGGDAAAPSTARGAKSGLLDRADIARHFAVLSAPMEGLQPHVLGGGAGSVTAATGSLASSRTRTSE